MKAQAEESPWSITDTSYEVAKLESESHHDHPFDSTKYLLGDWLYGNGEQHNITVDLKMHGITETPMTWKFNLVKGYQKGGTTRYTTLLRASNSSGTYNICNATEYPESTNPDEYAIGQLLAGKEMTFGGAMISTQYFDTVEDLSFYWRYTEASRIYVCYQIEGQSWKILEGTSSVSGNYSGTRGWDTYGYTTFNSGSWKTKELYQAKAKIALVVAGTKACDVQLGGVVINASRSADRYLNALTYQQNICDDSAVTSLKKGTADSFSNQDVFQLATENADGNFLANYSVVGSKSTESNALHLYNYLVTEIPALGSVKVASSNVLGIMNMNNSANIAVIASVSVAAAAVIGTGLFLGLRKRKHN